MALNAWAIWAKLFWGWVWYGLMVEETLDMLLIWVILVRPCHFDRFDIHIGLNQKNFRIKLLLLS